MVQITDKDKKRFWDKVDKRGKDECWEWVGSKMGIKYGKMLWQDKLTGAHRVSWMIFNDKEIPEGMCVCHSCDNPSCVNPYHLWLGTYGQNIKDAYDKERKTNKGESCPNSILTREQVIEIRKAIANTEFGYGEVKAFCKYWANKYGVHWMTVESIKYNKTWKYIKV